MDRTVDVVKPFLTDPRVRLLDKRCNEGKAMALNDALPLTRGDLVVIVDSDALPDATILRHMVPHFESARVAAVAGNPRVYNRRTLLAKLQAIEFSSVIGLLRRAQRAWGRVMCVSGVAGMYGWAVIRPAVQKQKAGFPRCRGKPAFLSNPQTSELDRSLHIRSLGFCAEVEKIRQGANWYPPAGRTTPGEIRTARIGARK